MICSSFVLPCSPFLATLKGRCFIVVLKETLVISNSNEHSNYVTIAIRMLLLDGGKIPVLQGTGKVCVQNLWSLASTFPVHSTCQHVEGTCSLCTHLI